MKPNSAAPFGPPPAFPYGWLVRAPLIFGGLAVLLFIYRHVGFGLLQEASIRYIDALVGYCIFIPGSMQLVALPAGIYASIFGPPANRLEQVLALSCGFGQLLIAGNLMRINILC